MWNDMTKVVPAASISPHYLPSSSFEHLLDGFRDSFEKQANEIFIKFNLMSRDYDVYLF